MDVQVLALASSEIGSGVRELRQHIAISLHDENIRIDSHKSFRRMEITVVGGHSYLSSVLAGL